MKTSNKLLLSLLIVALIAVTAFIGTAKHYHRKGTAVKGDGNRTTEARTVNDYSGIKIKGKIDLRLTQGSERKIEVHAAKNIVPLITTEVREGMLVIETASRIEDDEEIEVNITTPAMEALEVMEGAFVETTNTFTGDKLTINGNSGGNGKLNLQYKNVICRISTGSEFDLDGASDEASLAASTGANLDAGDLTTQKCTVEANTGSNTSVNVVQELSADLNTGSVLSYRGDPAKTNINSSTGSTVRKR
jgi:hypothetical protein